MGRNWAFLSSYYRSPKPDFFPSTFTQWATISPSSPEEPKLPKLRHLLFSQRSHFVPASEQGILITLPVIVAAILKRKRMSKELFCFKFVAKKRIQTIGSKRLKIGSRDFFPALDSIQLFPKAWSWTDQRLLNVTKIGATPNRNCWVDTFQFSESSDGASPWL